MHRSFSPESSRRMAWRPREPGKGLRLNVGYCRVTAGVSMVLSVKAGPGYFDQEDRFEQLLQFLHRTKPLFTPFEDFLL